MNNRERFLSVLNFEKPDEFPVMEYMGFWPEVKGVWRGQGLESDCDLFEHFGLMRQREIPIDFNFVPAFEKKIIEETAEHMVLLDVDGCTKKIEKNSSAMPHYLEFPIKNRRDFEAVKERLDPLDCDRRYPKGWDNLVEEYKSRDYPLGLLIRGPFAFCRDFMKFEDLMMMVYDDKQLIVDMMNFQVDFIIKLWERAVQDVDVDFVYLGEDMAYKTGPMFSPALCEELLKPLYQKLSDFFKSNRIDNFILDSDGCVLSLLPMFVGSGVTGILPMENAAGMDPVAVRQQYPRLQMIGGVDKLKIAKGTTTIDEEIAKVKKLVVQGGYIPSFDHSVPPVVSYANYCEYMNKLKEVV